MAEDKAEKPVVESFQLDHTKVKAPYVRYIDTETGPHGDVISNYDLRLTQPNKQAIPTGGLLTWGTHPTEEVAKALKESLEFIAYKATWDDVPATTEKSCGNYRDHSLFTAKEWAKQILEEGISSDPFERKVV